LTRRVLPQRVSDRHIPWVASFWLVTVWLVAVWLKISWCLQPGVNACA
jgi:hypothetical protein